MARPRSQRQVRRNPEERAKLPRAVGIQQERTERRNRKEARVKEKHDRIERLLTHIVERARGETFGHADALIEFEEARMLALAAMMPAAAVNATFCKCKLMGLMIDKHAIGRPGEFHSLQGESDELEEQTIERLRERIGSDGADEFMRRIADMRRAYRGDDVINGEATEIEE